MQTQSMQSGNEQEAALLGREQARPAGAAVSGAPWGRLLRRLAAWRRHGSAEVIAEDDSESVELRASGWRYDPADPLVQALLRDRGTVALDALPGPSPLAARMRADGAVLAVPLLNNGELVGILSVGEKRSEQRYDRSDRMLLDELAAQAAPALHVAHLVRRQKEEAAAHGRLEQELRLARDIQLALLPAAWPQLPGWSVAGRYTPARTVGGDFYDFVPRARGSLGILIADVSGKGMAAALLMATTRSILRSVIDAEDRPGEVLRRANTLLLREIPKGFFVTCLYGLLDPATGRLTFANAGHNLPLVQRSAAVVPLRARGMPLGLMEDMIYEEHETSLGAGDMLLLYSDGLVEAHDARRGMYGQARLSWVLAHTPNDPSGRVLDSVLEDWQRFISPYAEQEDDLTLIALRRLAQGDAPLTPEPGPPR